MSGASNGPLQKRCGDRVVNALAATSVIVHVEHATNSSSVIFVRVTFRHDVLDAFHNLAPIPRLGSRSHVVIVVVERSVVLDILLDIEWRKYHGLIQEQIVEIDT